MKEIKISLLMMGLSMQLFAQASMKGIQIREVYHGPLYVQTTLGGWEGMIRVFWFEDNNIVHGLDFKTESTLSSDQLLAWVKLIEDNYKIKFELKKNQYDNLEFKFSRDGLVYTLRPVSVSTDNPNVYKRERRHFNIRDVQSLKQEYKKEREAAKDDF